MSLTLRFFLIVGLILITGCSFRQFPPVEILVLDVEHQVCAKYKIIDKERLTVQHIADHPIILCEGMIGFSFKDYNESVKPWIRDAIKELKKKQPSP
jgi:hypothetical protein